MHVVLMLLFKELPFNHLHHPTLGAGVIDLAAAGANDTGSPPNSHGPWGYTPSTAAAGPPVIAPQVAYGFEINRDWLTTPDR